MFTFDLQRFDSITDDDYNLKQGLRNIITSLNSKIEGEYVMASNANMTIDDVVDTIINALQSGGGSAPAIGLLNPNLRIVPDAALPLQHVTWDGDGVCTVYDLTDEGYNYTVRKDIPPLQVAPVIYLLESDGTYRRDWMVINNA